MKSGLFKPMICGHFKLILTLGLPEGSIRALIALILLLVFIIVGIYLFRSVSVSPVSQEGAQLAQQFMTTIGTLVVAVAGFYFGTTAVAAAREVTKTSLPLIRSIDPKEGIPDGDLPLKIMGKNFYLPKEVRLVRGSNEIIATGILSSNTEILCKITIPSDTPVNSTWDLIVTNEDGEKDILPEAFVVKSS